jgi:glycogen phosphorylase
MTHIVSTPADILADRVKHYLVTQADRTLEEATCSELYLAFCLGLREEIMVNWAATRRSFAERQSRMLYYLSMEYLPGRILGNTATNLQSMELVKETIHKLGRDFHDIAACEEDPGLGNGGLGRLASCFLDSLATHHYPAMAYGLRYQYGIFHQEVWDGLQVEAPDTWLIRENPWHARRDFDAQSVKFCGRTIKTANPYGEAVYNLSGHEEVRALPYDVPIVGYCDRPDFSVLTLRLWSTKESPRNFQLQRYNAGQLDQAAENTTLTDVLYPADYHELGRRVRLKQEFLLVSASLQDILKRYRAEHKTLDDFAGNVRIQINDTHPAIVVAELIRLLTAEDGMRFSQAWEITQAVVGFTNHTILKEALEEWDQDLLRYLLPRQYLLIERLNDQFCQEIRTRYSGNEEKVNALSILEHGKVRMANLAIYGSHKVNGVAALHTNILKASTFRDFYEMYPEKFVNCTNGVTQRRWLLHCNPELSALITRLIGNGWITHFEEMERLRDFASDQAVREEFLAIKRRNKEKLVHLIRHENVLRDHNGRSLRSIPLINPDSLFDVQIKRVHEYKRQLLNIIHAIMVYQEMCENPKARTVKRTIIIGGKAAAGYRMAKNIIRLIYLVARKINTDTTIDDALKVVFIENYNVSRAQVIIPAADLSEQISTASMEASGTGNMKLAMNGALTIGTDDGANVEMRESVANEWWPFLFGASASQIQEMKADASLYKGWDIYSEFPKIRHAIDSLRDGTFSRTDDEQQALEEIHASLLESTFDTPADRYFVLHDLPAYYETQRRVEQLYADPHKWAEFAIHNIAGMSRFSSDRSIHDYADQVWGIEPCPPDPAILERIRQEYAEHVLR